MVKSINKTMAKKKEERKKKKKPKQQQSLIARIRTEL